MAHLVLEGVCVRLAVGERLAVPDREREGVPEREGVGLGVLVRDCVWVELDVEGADAVDVAVRVCVELDVAVAGAEDVPLPVLVPLPVPVEGEENVPDLLPLLVEVEVDVPLPLLVRVAVPVAEAVPALDAELAAPLRLTPGATK